MLMLNRRSLAVLLVVCFSALSAITATAQTPTPTIPPSLPETTPEATEAVVAPVDLLVPEVISTIPHDTNAYTQGLVLDGDHLYESAGSYGVSSLRRLDPLSGEVLQEVAVPAEFFAEGLALVGDRLIQITWQEHEAFVYDRDSFETLQTFAYDGEGWGLCYDGTNLWMSDGSENLVTRDPQTFAVTSTLPVTLLGEPLSVLLTPNRRAWSELNELECVGDSIYANVYLTDYILRIDKASGQVTGVVNASELLTEDERALLKSGEVLNGIAYNPETDTFLLTGKHWPKMFEVRWKFIRQISATASG